MHVTQYRSGRELIQVAAFETAKQLNMRTHPERSVTKGLLAGVAAGLIASFAMSQFHSLFQASEPANQQDKEDSTVRAAAAISHSVFDHELTPEQKKIAGPVVHYGFGSSMAAAYGASVELAPLLQAGWGLPFGTAVWLGAHVLTVPALGFSEPVTESRPKDEAVELAAHLVYGVVAEGVRRALR